ncbi:hypothetical protein EMQ25_05785 [Arsenicitalea aurantiaca]|uniref:Uncharacterized protein n=1 Tax=Arsenicitalea aurantiaca TaxID=1783274 RepID=A0A433XF21_9HYPH|nr:hypothetical protein [Arsenicitalea aurantiaca]RUT32656.1 hypothetical protein EMQ25_05785 [Arsenicitalea aurantiaca]
MHSVLIVHARAHQIWRDTAKADVPPLSPELMADVIETAGPVEDGWSWDGEIFSPPASPPPPTYRLYRSVFIARQSNAESGTLETALQQAEPKLRQMFYASEYFVSDDPLFAVLHWTVAEALGETRADELLAQEEQ